VKHCIATGIIHLRPEPTDQQPIRDATADVEGDHLAGGDADLIRVSVNTGNVKGSVRWNGSAFRRAECCCCPREVERRESGDTRAGLLDEFATI